MAFRVSLVCSLMDNINFEFLNASQGSRLQSQPQPSQPFNLQDVNMIHYNQPSPWSTETSSCFTPYDCTTNQSFSGQCSSSKPYPSSFHPYHHQYLDPPSSSDQSLSMVPIQPIQDQYMKPLYQRSCANDFASSASYSLSFAASQDPQVCQFFLCLQFFFFFFGTNEDSTFYLKKDDDSFYWVV